MKRDGVPHFSQKAREMAYPVRISASARRKWPLVLSGIDSLSLLS